MVQLCRMQVTGIDTLTSNGPAHVLVWAMKPISYARHRFPPDVIRYTVWLYLRFTLSYRDVEDILAERGLMISNESIRRWVLKFGPIFARHLRAIRPKAYTWWHLDEGLNRWTANVHVARCRQRRRGPRDPCPAPGKTIERGAYRRV